LNGVGEAAPKHQRESSAIERDSVRGGVLSGALRDLLGHDEARRIAACSNKSRVTSSKRREMSLP